MSSNLFYPKCAHDSHCLDPTAASPEGPPGPKATAQETQKTSKAQAKTTTKKPAKKKVETRPPSTTPMGSRLPLVAEAQTTRDSPDNQHPPAILQRIPELPDEPPNDGKSDPNDSDYELDLCMSKDQERHHFSYSYEDNGPKPDNNVARPPANFFKNYQMRLMTEDDQLHTMRIASPNQVFVGKPLVAIRNIPKKRIRRLTSNGGGVAAPAAPSQQPTATSTPLAEKLAARSVPLPQDENDLEVANM